jgi:hypothetical protein
MTSEHDEFDDAAAAESPRPYSRPGDFTRFGLQDEFDAAVAAYFTRFGLEVPENYAEKLHLGDLEHKVMLLRMLSAMGLRQMAEKYLTPSSPTSK